LVGHKYRLAQINVPNSKKERLTDRYIQHWQSELRDTTGKLRSYKLMKEDFKREKLPGTTSIYESTGGKIENEHTPP